MVNDHIRHAGQHHALVGHGVVEFDGLPVARISAPPNSCRFRPVAVMMMSAAQFLAGAQLDPGLGEPLDGVGDDVGLTCSRMVLNRSPLGARHSRSSHGL